jgi:hypothetical protein
MPRGGMVDNLEHDDKGVGIYLIELILILLNIFLSEY